MLKRMKTVMIVAAAAALIVSAAYLPRIAAALLDGESRQARFSQINAVRLDIREKLTALGKLSLMRWLDGGIELSAGDARMTTDEVLAVAHEGFEPYYASGLMLPIEETYRDFYPLLIQDPDRPERYAVVWMGQIVQNTAPYSVVRVGIDDETGHILYLSFRAGDAVHAESENGECLFNLSEIYFQSLGITEYQTLTGEEIADGDDLTGIRYHFDDAAYGTVTVDFKSYGDGFEIGFPE